MGKLSSPQMPETEKACQLACSDDSDEDWPERKLARLAFRLAIMEKAATTLGALSFVWATVVLLGGFASTLVWIDFWVVTVVLVVEGARIFGRSQELEWERHVLTTDGRHRSSPRMFLSSVYSSFKVRRKRIGRASSAIAAVHSLSSTSSGGSPQYDPRRGSWASVSSSWHPLEQEAHRSGRSFSNRSEPRASLARNISGLLYCLQILSAMSCIGLSSARLLKQSYGDADGGDRASRRNLKAALNIFYSLAFLEATVSLVHKAYFETVLSGLGLLEAVNRRCGFCVHGVVCVNHFFYHVYSRCVKDTVFDACQADLTSYAMEQMMGCLPYQQLTGVRILRRFATGGDESRKRSALRKLGNDSAVVERLITMLAWGKPEEEEIRRCAAEVVCQLACRRQNALRVASIPGSMEAISSLLLSFGSSCSPGDADEGSRIGHHGYYDPVALSLLGLRILKRLARDHDNCGKIGNTRGLLPRIIGLIGSSKELFTRGAEDDPVALDGRLKAVKLSLALLKNLTGATGQTGKILRREISEIVFTVAKLRAILQHGRDYPQLQKCAVKVLLQLAMDEDARENIGDTGGVLEDLVALFLDRRLIEAGAALAMLSLESQNNCGKILRLGVVGKLVATIGTSSTNKIKVVSHDVLKSHYALMYLCAYSSEAAKNWFLRGEVEVALPAALKIIMEDIKEAPMGLAVQIFKIGDPAKIKQGFADSGIIESELATRLVSVLQQYNQPSVEDPRIRRYAIALAIEMMKFNVSNAKTFISLGLVEELQKVARTTCELECFNLFSGGVGLSRYTITIHQLVDTAMEMLAEAQR